MYDGKTNLIGGKWRSAKDGQTFESLNPARTSDVIGLFARSKGSDVEAAVAAAAETYPAWKRTPAPVRGAALFRMGIGIDPEAQIGPVINRKQLERIHRQGLDLLETALKSTP